MTRVKSSPACTTLTQPTIGCLFLILLHPWSQPGSIMDYSLVPVNKLLGVFLVRNTSSFLGVWDQGAASGAQGQVADGKLQCQFTAPCHVQGGVPPAHGGNLGGQRPPQGNWVSGSTEPGHSRPTAKLISSLLRATFQSQWLAAHPAVEMDMSNGLQLVSTPSHPHPHPNTYIDLHQGGPATYKSWIGNRASCTVLPLTLTSIK